MRDDASILSVFAYRIARRRKNPASPATPDSPAAIPTSASRRIVAAASEIRNGHERIRAGAEQRPRQKRRLTTGKPRHDRFEIAANRRHRLRFRAFIETCGRLRFDHREVRSLGAVRLPFDRQNRRRHATNAALREDMRRLRALRCCFHRHHGVALHHVLRDRVVAGPRRIRHDDPTVIGSCLRGSANRIIVVAGHTAHFRTIGRDRIGAALADGLVDVDDRADAATLRTPGNRAAMIAIGRGCDDQRRLVARRGVSIRQPFDRVGAAQRLEALQSEAMPLVLVADRRDAGFGREIRQLDQRCRSIAGPRLDRRVSLARPRKRENSTLDIAVGAGSVEQGIGNAGDRHVRVVRI